MSYVRIPLWKIGLLNFEEQVLGKTVWPFHTKGFVLFLKISLIMCITNSDKLNVLATKLSSETLFAFTPKSIVLYGNVLSLCSVTACMFTNFLFIKFIFLTYYFSSFMWIYNLPVKKFAELCKWNLMWESFQGFLLKLTLLSSSF